jgi:hypothetical protein
MNARSAVASFLLALASACSTGRPAEQAPAAQAPDASTVKTVCERDADCSPYHRCASGRCECSVDADCASSQACRGGLCLPR